MRRTLLLFSIFIFLSAAFSSRADAQTARRDSLLFEAAKCERIVYEAQNPREVNAALRRKAELYKQAGLYKEAGATLERAVHSGVEHCVGIYSHEPARDNRRR